MDGFSITCAIILKALKASGDIDELHAASSSFEELFSRWNDLHSRFAKKDYKLSTAQRKKVGAWIRTGILGDIVYQLEVLKTETEQQTSPAAPSLEWAIHWWTLIRLLYQISVVLSNPQAWQEPTLTSVLSTEVVHGIIDRLVNVFSNCPHFTTTTPSVALTPSSFDIFEQTEIQRVHALEIVALLLLSSQKFSSKKLAPHRNTYESVMRFAILSRRHIPPLASHWGNSVYSIDVVSDVLRSSYDLVRDMAGSFHDSNQGRRVSFAEVMGIEPDIFLGEALDTAEACGESRGYHEYLTVSGIVAMHPEESVIFAAYKHRYIRRSIGFLKKLWAQPDPDHGVMKDPRLLPDLQAGFISSWKTCLSPVTGIEPTAEGVDAGILFIIEKMLFSDKIATSNDRDLLFFITEFLAGWDRSLHNTLLLHQRAYAPGTKPLMEKLLSQSAVINSRVQQNGNLDPALRNTWKRFVSHRAKDLARKEAGLPSGPFCSNNGCESVEVASFRCKRCGTRFYCSKECQKANWRSHKIQCTNTA
ncbi:hypothetical protein DL93DRAFT_1378968 [Clavulina sp. PMI_390]|nr:hypothetical protein DL93DRAFT_1378968 [Clavulina sp. PMI_390]